jgi:hypothetical protein
LLWHAYSDDTKCTADLPRYDEWFYGAVERFTKRTDEKTDIATTYVVVAGPSEPSSDQHGLAG